MGPHKGAWPFSLCKSFCNMFYSEGQATYLSTASSKSGIPCDNACIDRAPVKKFWLGVRLSGDPVEQYGQ